MPIVGDVLADRYRVESVLGVGGMASVFLATDLRLDRQVAVKVLAANLAADEQFAERFNREAGAMAGISHPNVVAVYDVEQGDPTTGREPFYVMEYCDGGSLADRLRVTGRMAPADLVPIVAAVSDGLTELHGHGLVHRDIKPANILFAGDRPKLADFGVARTEERDGRDPLTLPGTTLGTLPYLAPELAAGGPPSVASDVYALGVTTVQSLTGQYPQGLSGGAAVTGSGGGAPLPVSAAAPDLGARFDAPLGRALDQDPADRPTPTELAAELAAGLELWGVAKANPGAIPAPDPAQVRPPRTDLDAPTRVAPPAAAAPALAPPPAPAPPPAAAAPSVAERPVVVGQPPVAERPAPRTPVARRRLVAPASRPIDYRGRAIAAILVVLLAVLILPRLLGAAGSLVGASPSASSGAAATASASALPSGLETMLAALDRVDAAIEAARGGKDGLGGKDANELAQLAGSVRTALDKGDLEAATSAAEDLSDRAGEVTKGLEKRRREALESAIHDLVAALSTD